MTDYISRADAIEAVCNAQCELDFPHYPQCDQLKYCEDIQALLALPSANAPKGDLISRKVLMDRLESFCKWCKDGRLQGAEFVWDCIVPNVPSAEAVQGEWTQISPAKIYECPVCHHNVLTDYIDTYNFCPSCGAIMKGGAE